MKQLQRSSKPKSVSWRWSECQPQIEEGLKVLGLILWDRKLLPKDPKHMVVNFYEDYDFIGELSDIVELISSSREAMVDKKGESLMVKIH